jgi:hypothetical protein
VKVASDLPTYTSIRMEIPPPTDAAQTCTDTEPGSATTEVERTRRIQPGAGKGRVKTICARITILEAPSAGGPRALLNWSAFLASFTVPTAECSCTRAASSYFDASGRA